MVDAEIFERVDVCCYLGGRSSEDAALALDDLLLGVVEPVNAVGEVELIGIAACALRMTANPSLVVRELLQCADGELRVATYWVPCVA